MLGFFPTPYPDELLYSIIARYHIRSGNISPKITLQELFGSTTTVATPDLPSNLNYLSKQLQHLFPNSVTDLIDRYTLYPFYRPFLPPQRDRLIDSKVDESSHRSEYLYQSRNHGQCDRYTQIFPILP